MANTERYVIDSIHFTKKEINNIQSAVRASLHLKWPKACFDKDVPTDTKQFAALYKTRKQGDSRPGYYVFTLPVFLKNGMFAVFFYRYYCGSQCGEQKLAIYKNQEGTWHYFQTITGADF